MNFLACNGEWLANANGLSCNGQLVTFTGQELADQINASGGTTAEEWGVLYDGTLSLFVSVFVFLCLKRVIK